MAEGRRAKGQPLGRDRESDPQCLREGQRRRPGVPREGLPFGLRRAGPRLAGQSRRHGGKRDQAAQGHAGQDRRDRVRIPAGRRRSAGGNGRGCRRACGRFARRRCLCRRYPGRRCSGCRRPGRGAAAGREAGRRSACPAGPGCQAGANAGRIAGGRCRHGRRGRAGPRRAPRPPPPLSGRPRRRRGFAGRRGLRPVVGAGERRAATA